MKERVFLTLKGWWHQMASILGTMLHSLINYLKKTKSCEKAVTLEHPPKILQGFSDFPMSRLVQVCLYNRC